MERGAPSVMIKTTLVPATVPVVKQVTPMGQVLFRK
jgi:hypothetical protein